MKTFLTCCAVVLNLLLFTTFTAPAVTFTNDAAIGFNNSSYDGADVVVTNCTLTVDGDHAFASLHVLNGGNVTHSFVTNGLLANAFGVTNESHVLNGTNAQELAYSNAVIASVVVTDGTGTITYSNTVDYLLGTSTNGLPTIQRSGTSTIPDGATVLVSYNVVNPSVLTGLRLAIAGDASIEAGGTINVDGRGYNFFGAPGKGAATGNFNPAGSGGGHAGYGGISASNAPGGNVYDLISQPVDKGSQGGALLMGDGGNGGGAIKLVVGGTLRIDGSLSAKVADGIKTRTGGGSGGSIWLTVQSLTGGGLISADGGRGEPSLGGGGGGGPIAIYYQTNTFAGSMVSRGGKGWMAGGAGTIFTMNKQASTGQLVIDNGGQTGTNTFLSATPPANVTVQAGAAISFSGSQSIANLVVASNAWVRMGRQSLSVSNNIMVQAGGGIVAEGTGFGAWDGPGRPGSLGGSSSGGGGYGGYGATSRDLLAGGTVYGSISAPVDAGSGGGNLIAGPPTAVGGAGGGAIQLTVPGTLTVDGRISADGQAGLGQGTGGGSGGSVWLTAGTLAGAGLISANGGAGNEFGGGGGGGRIAIYDYTNKFTGVMQAWGAGNGFNFGGAGTIYTKLIPAPVGNLVVDNGGGLGTNTPVISFEIFGVTVKNGGVVALSGAQSIGSLLVASNAAAVVSNLRGNNLTVVGSLTIQPGGSFSADGYGSPGGQGTGAGRNLFAIYGSGGGGSFGGYGAMSAGGAGTGAAYGSVTQPVDGGSGGGGARAVGDGGAGGGQIQLTVIGTLAVDGRLSADGFSGANLESGGGSGGSLWVTAGTLTGAGTISASGGLGNDGGGGGGGGRIALYLTTNHFTGVMKAWGAGTSPLIAGAGTIYTRLSNQSGLGLAVVANGGRTGTNTFLPAAGTPSYDLAVQEGGVASLSGLQAFGNLTVASNAFVVLAPHSLPPPFVIISGSATVQAGGAIIGDGLGYSGGFGPGAGKPGYFTPYSAGGGSYGGYGTSTKAGGPTGISYGFPDQPTDWGSGGGSYPSGTTYGGPGGGALRLNVTGTLTVDGRISSDGGTGLTQACGGGSGGSIWLNVGKLAGAGVISANGGAGYGSGGAGGGGRIAFYYSTNNFTGTVRAWGGASGTNFAGAGTIYTKPANQTASVLVDNGQQPGTNTTLGSLVSGFDLTLRGGATMTLWGLPTLRNLIVASNAWIQSTGQGQANVTVTGSATIQAGGGITADSFGPASGSGTGRGSSLISGYYGLTGGGGGFGGLGAASAAGTTGGGAYGTFLAAQSLVGSGGGPGIGNFPTNVGGAGGGGVRVAVLGTLTVDGRISADGGGGLGEGSGGGSGGSIWLTAGTLSGSGRISANGGAGIGLGGGGGGGRIALYYTTNIFAGSMSAIGGGGGLTGGAGTIYTQKNGQAMGPLLVDNAGQSGTNTPVEAASPFDLVVSGGAIVFPLNNFLVLSNLTVGTGSSLLGNSIVTPLDVAVLGDAVIQAGAVITVDGKGNNAASRPGGGQEDSASGIGSGAGYGGQGGASSVLPGGTTYGSAQQPVDFGSAGAVKTNKVAGGSEGGGALRLNVGGTLTLEGRVSANGNPALQDDSGGGSGGSIWITAGTFAGNGTIAANGGTGELYNGGGGGGGRIAVYSQSNSFAGLTSAFGAEGFAWGADGTVYFSTNFPALMVIAQSPTGTISNAVTSMDITFNTSVNPNSFATYTRITKPDGTVVLNTGITPLGSAAYRVNFDQQTLVGDYQVSVGYLVQDLIGHFLGQTYVGTFTIVLSVIQGRVVDTNGQPVVGVTIHPTGGLSSTITDSNGNYALGILPGWSGTVAAYGNNLQFVPGYLTYTNVTSSISNQNFLAVSGISPNVTAGLQSGNLALNWYGTAGLNYQTQFSTNLVDWLPYGNAIPGTNGTVQVLIPPGVDPQKFFRVLTSY